MNCYTIRITGKNIHRFIKKLYQDKINLLYLKITKNTAIIRVTYEDYKKIKNIKTIYDMKIISISGIKKLRVLVHHYYLFLLFFGMGLGFIIFLSNIIFRVTIVTTNDHLKNQISNELNNYGISAYAFKKSPQKLAMIKANLITKYRSSIEWLEIKERGVAYDIEIIERTTEPSKENQLLTHIVAKKDALIMAINARNGEIIKNKYEYVKKGDIIVSGIIYRQEEAISYVKASADVYGEVWYKVTVDYPLEYQDKAITKQGTTRYILTILGYPIFSYDQTKYAIVSTKVLLSNNIFNISKVKARTYVYTTKEYSYEEALINAQELAKQKITNKLISPEKIITQKNLKIVKENDSIYVEVFFKVYENIGIEKTFTKEELIE